MILNRKSYGTLISWGPAFAALYVVSRFNYPLFHSFVDAFSAFIAIGIFVIVWYSRRHFDNDYFLYLGIAFLFFAVLDFIHLLGNKNMGVFPGYGNLGPALYIASRYVLCISLVIAPLFINRRLRRVPVVFAAYSLITALILLSFFYWRNFPVCHVEGVGLTTFKVASDYAICLVLLIALVLLLVNRRSFDAHVLRLLAASIILSIATGLAFTLYTDPFGVMNAIGHFFQIISFYLIYRAVIETGLTRPQDIIFRKLQETNRQLEEAVTKANTLAETQEERVRERTAELEKSLTERKQAEEKLTVSEERYRKVIEMASEGIFLANSGGQYIDVNQAGCALLGYTREELLRLTMRDVTKLTPEAPLRMDELRLGKVLLSERELIRKDGSLLSVEISAKQLPDGRLQGIVRDITERKQAEKALHDKAVELEIEISERQRAQEELGKLNEELEQRVQDRTTELEQANVRLQELDRMKSLFIASMSHELRTPLNSVIGFSSILLNGWAGPVPEKQKENLSIILRSGKHLLSLINDVIDVSKIEAGMIESFDEDFDVYDVVSEAISAFAPEMEKKGLEVRIEAIHHCLRADRRRLLQCLLNLLSNAVKFTHKGSVSLQARLRLGSSSTGQVARQEKGVQSPRGGTEASSNGQGEEGNPLLLATCPLTLDSDFVEISVEDTGIGIKEEDRGKLFSPFVRLDSPMRSSVLGTGLGLYLTKKLITEVLHGNVSVHSVYGEGSRFAMHVPIPGPGRT